MFLDAPQGFKSLERIQERRAMLDLDSSVQPLREWAAGVADKRRTKIPDIWIPSFDPAEAGVDARVLLLFEAPGPRTVPEWGGSGFISVDNYDVSAKNVWIARDLAGLHTHTLAWNIVPWVLGRANRKPTDAELAQGSIELRGLLALLPQLRVIVLGGQFAQRAWDRHLGNHIGENYRVLRCPHPSGQSFARAGNRQAFFDTMSIAAERAR